MNIIAAYLALTGLTLCAALACFMAYPLEIGGVLLGGWLFGFVRL